MKYSPPDLTDSSLLTVEIRNSGVCHVVSIIDESQPSQDLLEKFIFNFQFIQPRKLWFITLETSNPFENDLKVDMKGSGYGG